MSDLISRQAAIDAIFNADFQIYEGDWAVGRRNYMTQEEACSIIDSLPSVESEIIRCKDCKLFGDEKCLMCFDGYDWAESDGYCHCAERRTDEGSDFKTGGD